VGICFDNSSVQAIAILATLLAGRVPVMINSVDLFEARLDWIHHAKLTYVIVSEDLADRVQVPRLVMNSKGGMISVAPPQAVRGSNDAGFLPPLGTGVILFTSGSTGEPKEIYIPETGILRTIDNLKKTFSLNDETIASVTLPMCHSMALNTQFFPAFLVGGKSRFYNLRLQINKVFRGFLRDQSTFVALIGEIVRTAWEERRRKGLPACESVEHVQLAGGLITPLHLEMTRELFPNALIHKGYGLTEAIRVTMISSENPLFAGTAVGQPLPFLELQIRSETGDVLSAGQYGEVYVRGESVMLGMRSLTSDHIRLTKASDFLPTGDLGMLDQNGYLHVSGRLDSLFKINGRRVSGVEIEKVALASDEHFRFAKAILVADEDRGRSRIILFVELDRSSWQNGMLHLAPEIQERLAERMRQLSVPPREIIFIKQIPRTSNGKLNLPQLKRIWMLRSMRPIEKVTHLNFKLFSVDEEVWL
jgi:acyl-coenzyme A synthetase/AMP-(fatty) acid ligase